MDNQQETKVLFLNKNIFLFKWSINKEQVGSSETTREAPYCNYPPLNYAHE